MKVKFMRSAWPVLLASVGALYLSYVFGRSVSAYGLTTAFLE